MTLFLKRGTKALSQNNLSNFVYPVTFYTLGNIV